MDGGQAAETLGWLEDVKTRVRMETNSLWFSLAIVGCLYAAFAFVPVRVMVPVLIAVVAVANVLVARRMQKASAKYGTWRPNRTWMLCGSIASTAIICIGFVPGLWMVPSLILAAYYGYWSRRAGLHAVTLVMGLLLVAALALRFVVPSGALFFGPVFAAGFLASALMSRRALGEAA